MEVESDFCSGCDCPKNEIQIVQNVKNVLWASACAAGCKTDLGGSSFSNCTCTSDENVSSKIRLCDNSAMYGMLLMWGLMSFSHGITGGPYISLLLSNIPRETKVITFGLMHLLMKVIGFGPGPLIAGVAIDKNCVFWKTSNCGKRQSCQLYEFEGYRESFTALMLIPGLLTLPGFILVYWKTSRKERCPLYEIARRESESEKLNPST